MPEPDGSPSEVRSLSRHVCPECGGKGEWNPRKRKLICPYCGSEFERVAPPPPPDSIKEHDLDAMLAELGDKATEVDSTKRQVECSNCHAVLLRDGSTVAQHCDFCGSPELLSYEDIGSPLQPESLMPARISKEDAYHAIKKFLASKWFAPNDLKRRNLIDRIHRVYIPYWTFDAAAECPWTADSGTYYYVTVQRRGSDGKMHSSRERRTRWRPASGHISTWFDDIFVSASKGLEPKILSKLEPYPSKELVPYETRYVSGWQVEQYQVPLLDAARLGFGTMEALLRESCGREVPGDTYRNLQIRPTYSRKTFKHILVPIWIISYQYRGKIWQGAMNAVTGTAYANSPLSAWKVTFVVLISIAVIMLIIYLVNQ